MNKWDKWYDNLPKHTQEYLNNQPLWLDSDMWKSGIIGIFVGVLLAVIFRGG